MRKSPLSAKELVVLTILTGCVVGSIIALGYLVAVWR